MYFNDKKNNTNIDHEFSDNNDNILSRIVNFISKYKKIFIIGIVVIVLLIAMLLIFINKKSNNSLILNGDEIITIYQGDSYIEPGYKAYNLRDEDLSGDVKLESNLNTGVIGEYEILYKLGDITKVRYVKVIEKPQDYVFMSLTPVNDNIDIYLKKGDKYIEPGYSAFSTSGIDLTDKVTITGKVDTFKKGTYTLTYSVIDTNGVKISKVRKVIVMDSEISLTLNNDSYTNQEVIINAYVIDEYFDYMILPDNNKVTMNNYSYKVSSNGTYTFKVYDRKGNSKESSIKVNNIDKEAPSGSCSGSYKDGVSSINVNASDNVGIANYVVNGKSYTSKKITINNELKTVNVTINDKAGNSKKISCNLEDKNVYEEDTSENNNQSNNNTNNNNNNQSNNNTNNNNNNSSSLKITYVDVTNLSCTIVYNRTNVITKIPVRSDISDEFYNIMSSVCDYVKSSPYIDKLNYAGAYVNRPITQNDYHSKGVAIDLNNLWSVTYNGKTYYPYSSQGEWMWSSYNNFICEVCNGKEDCEYNINYIIFKRYFEPKGWCWGGNYSPKYFDPMHFEIRDGGCATGNRAKLSCK